MISNKNNIKRITIIIILSFCFAFSPIYARPSYAWDAIPAAQFKQMLEEISYHIKGVILGALKQQAAKMLSQQVNKLVGGSGGNALIITDWQDYLIKQPQNNTKLYMNDYLSQITAGRGSITGYKSEGFGGAFGGSGGGYASQLVQMAKSSTINPAQPKMTFEGNPATMFAQGNFKQFDSFLSGVNNPWSFDANAQAEYQKKLAEEKLIAQTQGVAYQGFRGVGQGQNGKGIIKTPGSVIAGITINAQDIGNKIIASATHPEEVISAVVSQTVNQVMTQGIGQVQSMINQQIGKVTSQLSSKMSSAIKSIGPAASYSTTFSSGVKVPTSTSSQMPAPGSASYDYYDH